MYNPGGYIQRFSSPSQAFQYPLNKIDWQNQAGELIKSKSLRTAIAERQLLHLTNIYGAGKWESRLQRLYLDLKAQVHQPKIGSHTGHFMGPDEKELIEGARKRYLEHLSHTENLPFFQRVKHLVRILDRPTGVSLSKRKLLTYLFKY